jgi:hypothetical protein
MSKDHLPWEGHRLAWVCPVCGRINVWDWNDAERLAKGLGVLVEELVTCSGSCFDNICGGCGSNIVQPDSPILSECYTLGDGGCGDGD